MLRIADSVSHVTSTYASPAEIALIFVSFEFGYKKSAFNTRFGFIRSSVSFCSSSSSFSSFESPALLLGVVQDSDRAT